MYYGEEQCCAIKKSGLQCTNKAYYLFNDEGMCGVHAKDKSNVLPKNPNAKQEKEDKLKEHNDSIIRQTKINNLNKVDGDIILSKIMMRKEIPTYDGYLKVFPNYKHENRKDGYGCAALSPKSLGPVEHGQPGLPICKNLENFHQGNKVYEEEVDPKTGNPKKIFFQRQLEMYEDEFPWRHKYEKYPELGKNVKYSYWIDGSNKGIKLSYFESRQIYCVLYEHLVKKDKIALKELNYLKSLINKGTNLQICGYDAYQPKTQDLIFEYKDISKPFGHELVLYCMLKNITPWKTFITLNNIIYQFKINLYFYYIRSEEDYIVLKDFIGNVYHIPFNSELFKNNSQYHILIFE
jgi:hypothetical protein